MPQKEMHCRLVYVREFSDLKMTVYFAFVCLPTSRSGSVFLFLTSPYKQADSVQFVFWRCSSHWWVYTL